MKKPIILQELGLTEAESTIYTSLLRLGECQLGDILKETLVSPSNAHKCLESLTLKGMVSFITKNNVKHYTASPPETLRQILKKQREDLQRKETELDKIIPSLQKLERITKFDQNAEVFIGFKGLMSAFKKLCTPIIPGLETYFLHKFDKETVELVTQFFARLESGAEYLKIPAKGLCSEDYRSFVEKRQTTVELRFTTSPIPSNINIYADKVLLISWSKNPIAFLIQSKQIASVFEEYFKGLWDLEKKKPSTNPSSRL